MTIGEILKHSRRKANKSQQYVALEMNRSLRTIQNWEQGVGCPDIDEFIQWFKAIGSNPIPYLLVYVHPDQYTLAELEDAEGIRAMYKVITQNLTVADKKALVYIFGGTHGSSPSSVVQLILAHLHNPLRDRIMVAEHILKAYRLNLETGKISDNTVAPNLEMLDRAIEAAIDSLSKHQRGYTSVKIFAGK